MSTDHVPGSVLDAGYNGAESRWRSAYLGVQAGVCGGRQPTDEPTDNAREQAGQQDGGRRAVIDLKAA